MVIELCHPDETITYMARGREGLSNCLLQLSHFTDLEMRPKYDTFLPR